MKGNFLVPLMMHWASIFANGTLGMEHVGAEEGGLV
jgi:hypothetical protein